MGAIIKNNNCYWPWLCLNTVRIMTRGYKVRWEKSIDLLISHFVWEIKCMVFITGLVL